MALFGGSSSSKEEENTQQSAGFSEIGGPVNSYQLNDLGSGKFAKTNVNISQTDYGAVNAAFTSVDKIANNAIAEIGGSQRNALDFGSTSLSKVLDFALLTNEKANRQVTQTNENFTNKFSEFANRQTSSSDQKVTDIVKWGMGAVAAVLIWSQYQKAK